MPFRLMMLAHRAALLFLLSPLCLVGDGDVTSLSPFEPTTGPRVAATLKPPDTLRTVADPDTPLILSLPAELDGEPVARYIFLRGPALSGVAGRSFTWIPQGAELGTHETLLRARGPDAPGDTLVLRIDLQP